MFKDKEIPNWLVAILVFIAIIVAVYSQWVNDNICIMEDQEITATVIDKQYVQPTYTMIGKVSEYVPEKYNITLEYQEFQETIDSKIFYDNHKIGEQYKCVITTKYSLKRRVLEKHFKII